MWLIVGQLPIKAECRDAPLAVRDFNQINKQKLSANVVSDFTSAFAPIDTTNSILCC